METEHSETRKNTQNLSNFEYGHPRAKTIGHRNRIVESWPAYSGKRLLDLNLLEENSNVNDLDRNAKREEYAKGVLVMFHHLRKLSGSIKNVINN